MQEMPALTGATSTIGPHPSFRRIEVTEWRQFHTPFHTYDTEAAYALAEAYRFIDLQNPQRAITTP
jgi:hypothetical protein